MKITERQLRKIISKEIDKVINLQEGEALTMGERARGLLDEEIVSAVKAALRSGNEEAIEEVYKRAILNLADEFESDELAPAAKAAIQEIYNEMNGKIKSRY